ncbi:MAG: hypothetical protein ACLR7U_03125, partial [Ruthenibacterium lactatiformans]
YDYFGVKGGASSEDSVITRVRAYLSAPEDAIILGDSRMAHFDMNAVAEASGRGWSNLAFGGASLNESIDLFYLAAENNPSLNTCYFGVSFYTLRAGDSRNRMEAIGTVVKTRCYMLNFDYNADMLGELLLRLQGVQTARPGRRRWEAIDSVDEDGNALPVRRNLIAYAATLYQNCASTLPAVKQSLISTLGRSAGAAPIPALCWTMLAATPADSSYSLNWENLRRLEGWRLIVRETALN